VREVLVQRRSTNAQPIRQPSHRQTSGPSLSNTARATPTNLPRKPSEHQPRAAVVLSARSFKAAFIAWTAGNVPRSSDRWKKGTRKCGCIRHAHSVDEAIRFSATGCRCCRLLGQRMRPGTKSSSPRALMSSRDRTSWLRRVGDRSPSGNHPGRLARPSPSGR
jgi:hypothetical protein